ncbi:MAG TPA: choice-of-anchor D domain-containing protein [Candidatus Sumerlaeota bacterium]|nr:choice-of-anchor D domain-containing protein [Candidatus Sumerlaeota bacterium]
MKLRCLGILLVGLILAHGARARDWTYIPSPQALPGFPPPAWSGYGPNNSTSALYMTESAVGLGSRDATITGQAAICYVPDGSALPAAVEYDLGDVYNLYELYYWTPNYQGYQTSVMKNVEIAYKVNAGDSYTVLKTVTMAKGAAAPDVEVGPTNQDGTGDPVDLENVQARYLRLTYLDNWGGPYHEAGKFRVYQAGQPLDQVLTLANYGPAGKTGGIQSIDASALDGTAFSLVNPPSLPASLNSGQSLALTIRFNGADPNTPYTADLPIEYTDQYGTHLATVHLTGQTEDTPVAFALTPATHDFGTVQVGQTQSILIELTNDENAAAAATVDRIEISGGGQLLTISAKPGLPLVLDPGEIAEVEVQLHAHVSGLGPLVASLEADFDDGVDARTLSCDFTALIAGPEPTFIPNVAATASTYYYETENYHPKWLVETEGEVGVTEVPAYALGSKQMLHSSAIYLAQWYSTYLDPWEIQWVEFDLQQVYSLGQMWVWNLNFPGTGYFSAESGMKDVHVLYKTAVDDAWSTLTASGGGDVFTLAKAAGADDQPATNLHDPDLPDTWGDPVPFGGLQARYVRIQQASVAPGEGNWGGGGYSYAGLAHVRFYQSAPPPNAVGTGAWAIYR